MDASQRLEQVTARRAEQEQQRALAEIRQRENAVYTAVMGLASKNGVDLTQITHATDGDFTRKDAELHHERLSRQAELRLQTIPTMLRGARLHPASTAEHVIAQHWLDQYRAGVRRPLVILGTVGTGKSYVAAALAVELSMRDHIPVMFTTEAAFSAAMRATSSGGASSETDMQLYMLAPVLVLDDFGADRPTPWSLSQLLRLMHHRWHNSLPTIITSNLKPAEIRAYCGDDERLVQRLAGGAELITMAGASRRPMPEGF